MKRAAAAMLIATAVTACVASPNLSKPTTFQVEEIRKELKRLSGSYVDSGALRHIGGGGCIRLDSNGTFEYSHPSCTEIVRKTAGQWHPYENRIEFEPEFVAVGFLKRSPKMHIEWARSEPIKDGDWSNVPWARSGLEIVGKDQFPALYPLDPALRREIAAKPTGWPMRKMDDARR